MMAEKLFILTANYPYHPGEQFLETEMKHWDNYKGDIVIVPKNCQGKKRELPSNSVLNLKLAKQENGIFKKSLNALKAFFSNIFWKEVGWLLSNQDLSFLCIKIAFKTTVILLLRHKVLCDIFKTEKNASKVYCYWNDLEAYASVLAKRKGLVTKVISRAHGKDVYEVRREGNYMPLKRQFASDFDYVISISDQAKKYLLKTYGIPEEKIRVSRLGVKITEHYSEASGESELNILSVSFCAQVKRLDKIISVLPLLANRLSDMTINWTHIGAGVLKNDLEKLAWHKLKGIEKCEYSFLGHLENAEVLNYMKTNNIDVFLNTSDSEGVPVSIMEAMSFGIPAIAPCVGGIPELVNNSNGKLISCYPSIKEITNSLVNYSHFKNAETRRTAKKMIMDLYNADTNYKCFIEFVSAL